MHTEYYVMCTLYAEQYTAYTRHAYQCALVHYTLQNLHYTFDNVHYTLHYIMNNVDNTLTSSTIKEKGIVEN